MEYTAIVSLNWNECLAPCGPFDPISLSFPDLCADPVGIFRQYAGNGISLTEATGRILALMPGRLTREQMDRYLETSVSTCQGVPEPTLHEYCRRKGTSVHKQFGVSGPTDSGNVDQELSVDFMEIACLIEDLLDLPSVGPPVTSPGPKSCPIQPQRSRKEETLKNRTLRS